MSRPIRKGSERRERRFQDRLTRQSLADGQGGRCHWCRSPMNGRATTEHVQPRARGGADIAANKKAACEACNNAKGDLPPGRFLKKIKHPGPDDPPAIWRCWLRRKLSLRTERAVRRIARAVGMNAE